MSGVAIGTVADALAGIRKHVFDDRTLGMAELIEALDHDWQGSEVLRQTLVNKTPHFGNDDDYADELAVPRAGHLLLSGGEPYGHTGGPLLGGPAARPPVTSPWAS